MFFMIGIVLNKVQGFACGNVCSDLCSDLIVIQECYSNTLVFTCEIYVSAEWNMSYCKLSMCQSCGVTLTG